MTLVLVSVAAFLIQFPEPTALASPPLNASTSNPTPSASGNGCPSSMQTWAPNISGRITSSNISDISPTRLSTKAKTAFVADASRALVGRRIHWIKSIACSVVTSPGPKAPANHSPTGGVTADTEGNEEWTYNWSGYQSDDANFTEADMTWTVPAIDSPSDISAAVSVWPGIGTGDSSSDQLIQAGSQTEHLYYEDGLYTHNAIFPWVEIYPQESELEIGNLPISAGQEMYAEVQWDPTSDTATFLLCNETTNDCGEATQRVNGSSGSTAEWIMERPLECYVSCNFPSLDNYGTSTMYYAEASQTVNGTTTTNFIPGFNDYYPIEMENCAGTEALAVVDGTPSNLGIFNDYWDNYGPSENC